MVAREAVEGEAAGDVDFLEVLGAVADGAVLAEDGADVLPVGGVGRLREIAGIADQEAEQECTNHG